MDAAFLQHVEGLRAFYPKSGNEIGDLLDELIKDIKAGAPRKEVKDDCRALLKKLDPESNAYRTIERFKAARKRKGGIALSMPALSGNELGWTPKSAVAPERPKRKRKT